MQQSFFFFFFFFFLSALFDAVISFALLVIILVWFGTGISWHILLMPLFILQLVVSRPGVGLWLSAIDGIFRDLRHALPLLLQLGMFVSPVAYTTSALVPPDWQWLYEFNPLVAILEGFRWSMIPGAPAVSLAVEAKSLSATHHHAGERRNLLRAHGAHHRGQRLMSAIIKRFVRTLMMGRLAEARRAVERCDPFVQLSYSQDGEDMILRRMFENQGTGFYVTSEPTIRSGFSNTCYFHRRGWRGINIDANPAAIRAFNRSRPSDTNICSGVAETRGKLTFHQFNEPALNTFDPELAVERAALPGYRLVDQTEVDVARLDDVLLAHLPAAQAIDFLSVDVEGFDLQVLRSNDWTRFRPKALLVEARGSDLSQLEGDPACAFAQSVGYRPLAKTVNTVIFVEGMAV